MRGSEQEGHSDLSYGLLNVDSRWDSLRDDPRFEKLVADLGSNQPGWHPRCVRRNRAAALYHQETATKDCAEHKERAENGPRSGLLAERQHDPERIEHRLEERNQRRRPQEPFDLDARRNVEMIISARLPVTFENVRRG